jgi:hypothetical protein
MDNSFSLIDCFVVNKQQGIFTCMLFGLFIFSVLFSVKRREKDPVLMRFALCLLPTPLTYAFAQYNLIQPRPLKRSNLDTQELEFRLYNLPCSCMLTTVLRVTLEIQGR